MASARVTQIGVEYSGVNSANARLTQLGVEYSGLNNANARLTQLGVEYSGVSNANARLTQLGIEYSATYPDNARVTQVAVCVVAVPILEGYYDVSSYRLVGDPDDTASILRAQSACEAAGGGVVYFPAGQYRVSGTITIGVDAVEWRGHGPGASTILSTASGTAPTVLATNSGVNDFKVADVTFQGNGVAPSGTLVSPPVVILSGGGGHKFFDCYFTNNTGQTIQCLGATDVEISRCRFYQVGYNDGSNTDSTYRTDAITLDSATSGARALHCYFDTCLFGAIYIGGTQCEASHNFITSSYVSAIYSNGDDVRIGLNRIEYTRQLINATTQSGAITLDGASNHIVVGNNVSYSDGYGIGVINGWEHNIVLGNNVWNHGQKQSSTIGQSGILINPDSSALDNEALQVVANNCFDDQGGNATQKYGIHFNATTNKVGKNCVVMGNSTYGNTSGKGIYEQQPVLGPPTGATVDDTCANVMIANSAWPEKLHSIAPTNTQGATTLTVIGSQTVPGGSMRQQCASRLTAGGTTLGTSQKTFELTFGSQPLVNITPTPSASSGIWQLVTTIVNNANSATAQAALVMFFLDSQLYQMFEVTNLIQDSGADQDLVLSAIGQSGSMTDYVTCDFFTVERC